MCRLHSPPMKALNSAKLYMNREVRGRADPPVLYAQALGDEYGIGYKDGVRLWVIDFGRAWTRDSADDSNRFSSRYPRSRFVFAISRLEGVGIGCCGVWSEDSSWEHERTRNTFCVCAVHQFVSWMSKIRCILPSLSISTSIRQFRLPCSFGLTS